MDWGIEIVRRPDHIAIVRLIGSFTIGPRLHEFLERVQKEISGGFTRLAIDMSETKYLDSAGTGQLVIVFTSLYKVAGKGVIIAPDHLRAFLQISRLSDIFTIVDTEVDAIAILSRSEGS